MNTMSRFKFLSAILVLAYVLSACNGAPAGAPQQPQAVQQSGEPQQVVFTGTVQSMGSQWTVSGQSLSVDGKTRVDANIAVGSNVRVEASVDAQGVVTAKSIELAAPDNTNANSNSNANTNVNDNSSNTNDVNANVNDNSTNTNANTNTSTNANDNGNSNTATGMEQEIVGTVSSVQNGSITINGVTYSIADFTEFKDAIAAGDQVKVHVIVNADGTFTIREIEKVMQTTVDNGNSNSNGSDDNSNVNSNTNGDDHGGNNNSNDDHSNDNNDDHGNDNGGNSNGDG